LLLVQQQNLKRREKTFMRRRILTFIIMIVVLFCFSINVFSNTEATNTETQNTENNEVSNKTLLEQSNEVRQKLEESSTRLEYVQSELSTSLQQIQELGDKITEYENQYNDLKNQVAEMEANIAVIDADINKVQAEYDRKENLLKKRMVALYKAGDATYLDVLLSSSSIVDFLSKYYMLEKIIDYDTDLMKELEVEKNSIENKKQEQEKKKADLKVAKAKAGQMQILMENNKMLQENYSAKLTTEEATLNEQILQYKQEQEEIERQIQAAINWSGDLAIQYKGGVMIWPVGVNGTYITSPFGNRLHPIQGVYKYHSGIDIGNAGYGAPVLAAADGVVTYAGVMSGYGNCVMINHGSGIVTLYGHGQTIYATLGQTVKQGDVIMAVGSTGNSTGPHLHFEVRKDGVATSPIPFLKGEDNTTTDNENTTNNTEM
jgi:murein DD-endopeptidase MepM/ murein hydrolase activator NlpD